MDSFLIRFHLALAALLVFLGPICQERFPSLQALTGTKTLSISRDKSDWNVNPYFEEISSQSVGLGALPPEFSGLMASNAAPITSGDTYYTHESDTLMVAAPGILSNDTFSTPITITLVTDASQGTLTLDPHDGSFVYMPGQNFNVSDSFTYRITDGTDVSNTATVTLIYNHPPVANNDFPPPIQEDHAARIPVLSNDFDPDGNLLDPASVIVTGPPNHGSTTVITATGEITYTPSLNFYGSDTFNYQVCDIVEPPQSKLCGDGTVTMYIESVNDPPVANPDSANTLEDTPVPIAVLANDYDVDGTLNPGSVVVTQAPGHGSTDANSSTGAITYTPAKDFNGQDTFVYKVCDSDVSPLCSTAPVTVTVSPVNDPPVAVDDNATTLEDTPVDIRVLDNDSAGPPDEPQNLVIASISTPAHGTASLNGDNSINYQPAANYCGSDTFDYTIQDDGGLQATATVSVNITCVNDPPVAKDDAYVLNTLTVTNTNQLEVAAPGVLGNDVDVDAGDSLNASLKLLPNRGSLVMASDGSFIYSNDPITYTGTVTFTYQASDGEYSSQAEVKILVDLVPPTVNWVSSIGLGGNYEVHGQVVELEVDAADNLGISDVRFIWWNAAKQEWVELGSVQGAPYKLDLDTSQLNFGWSEIRVRAYDTAGNSTLSDRATLYRSAQIFLPMVIR